MLMSDMGYRRIRNKGLLRAFEQLGSQHTIPCATAFDGTKVALRRNAAKEWKSSKLTLPEFWLRWLCRFLESNSVQTMRLRMNSFSDTLHQCMHLVRVLFREWRKSKLEPEVPFMDRFLTPDAQCIHIGASDGRHSLYLARRVPQGQVHCVEPSSYTLDVLGCLRRIFGLTNIRLYNFAIGASNGEIYLVTPIKANGHRGRAFAFISETPINAPSTEWDSRFTGFENRPVQRRTLDGFCKENGITRIDFLRCDIEGAEILLLDGGLATIADERPVIMMEIHPVFIAQRFGRSAEEIWQQLADLDYRVFAVVDGGLQSVDHFFDEPWRDYFFVPAERLGTYGLSEQPGEPVAKIAAANG